VNVTTSRPYSHWGFWIVNREYYQWAGSAETCGFVDLDDGYEHFNLDPSKWSQLNLYNTYNDAPYMKAAGSTDYATNKQNNNRGGWGLAGCSYDVIGVCELPASTWTCRPPPSPPPPPPRPPSPPSPSFQSCEW
jgi:hypothetical protein